MHNDLSALTLTLKVADFVPAGSVHIAGFLDESQVPEGRNVNHLVGSALSDMGDGSIQYSTRVFVSPVE